MSNAANNRNSYVKLESGVWAMRILRAAGKPTSGTKVKVYKQDGSCKTEVIQTTLDSDLDAGVHICAIKGAAKAPQGARTNRRAARSTRGTRTGCSCGSVNEFSKSSDCWTCKHDS